jgi:hypothetical protein
MVIDRKKYEKYLNTTLGELLDHPEPTIQVQTMVIIGEVAVFDIGPDEEKERIRGCSTFWNPPPDYESRRGKIV